MVQQVLLSGASVSSTEVDTHVERGSSSGGIGFAVSMSTTSGSTPGGALSVTRGIGSTGV